jgi:hypothetical protein
MTGTPILFEPRMSYSPIRVDEESHSRKSNCYPLISIPRMTLLRKLAFAQPTCGLVIAICLTGACSVQTKTSANLYDNAPVLDARIGQSVKDVVDSLPASGGTVLLGSGVWLSGYNSGEFISKPNITIQGSGRPGFNSSFTAMSGGTIVLGQLPVSTGANFFAVRDLGVDAGSAYINSSNGSIATDALTIYNDGEVVGAPQLESIVIDDVSCLGYSTKAAFHCMLVENVNHARIHNVVTVMNQHGLVLKGTNSTVDGVFSRGHGIDSVLVKSDDYAPASQNHLSNIAVQPLLAAGDTKGIFVAGISAPVTDIAISNAQIHSPLAWGINVRGIISTAWAANLNFSDISVDYPGGSPEEEYCMRFASYVSNVQINNLNCFDMWAGIISDIPAANEFDSFTVRNSYFENIGTNAVQTYGSWDVVDDRFEVIAGNGIVDPNGITTVYGNTFIDITGMDMLPMGGTFAFGTSPGFAEPSARRTKWNGTDLSGPDARHSRHAQGAKKQPTESVVRRR